MNAGPLAVEHSDRNEYHVQRNLQIHNQQKLRARAVESAHVPTASCFLYTTSTNSWSVTGHMNQARIDHTLTLLLNGKVLVAGGLDRTLSAGFSILSSAELYTP
jgi:hypothetical protein